ncbi:hypothetical protein, partial [Salmonella sp. NW571]|uniref:hypothetical protein n=1 Tax=unclassified Salmonella TaxID=2614656 RepID=UPI003F68407C
MGSCAAPSAKGDDKFITTDYLQQCRAISASRRGPALRPKPASNRTLVIRRRQVEAYPNLMSDAMCKLRQDRIEF